jgi:hypothetical protein
MLIYIQKINNLGNDIVSTTIACFVSSPFLIKSKKPNNIGLKRKIEWINENNDVNIEKLNKETNYDFYLLNNNNDNNNGIDNNNNNNNNITNINFITENINSENNNNNINSIILNMNQNIIENSENKNFIIEEENKNIINEEENKKQISKNVLDLFSNFQKLDQLEKNSFFKLIKNEFIN